MPLSAYLDYAAATPLDPEVLEAMLPYLTTVFENPSAPYARARAARKALEEARAELAHLIGAKPGNVVFTAGATEANNLAFATVSSTGHVVTDAIEHDSVLACAAARSSNVVGVSGEGMVDPNEVARAIRPETELVSIELANGEIGALQPARSISQVVARERMRRLEAGETRPILFHVDASQAAGHVSVAVSSIGADLMTLSAAKVYGPKQMGLLYAAEGVRLAPIVLGGGQEGGLRSGTENVAGAVGFARALSIAERLRPAEARRLEDLRSRLVSRLQAEFGWMWISGPKKAKRRLPGLLSVSFGGIDARRLVVLLEREGVSVGTGSACAASRMQTSHVLQALGLPPEVAAGSLRISLGRPTTADEIDYAAEKIIGAVRSEMVRTGLTDEGQAVRWGGVA